MSSPVTGSDFIVASAGESLCTRLTRLLSLSAKLKTWFDWAFTSGGDAQNSLKAMFLPPPGTVMAYYSTQPFASVQATVEGWGLDAGDTNGPFWRICDGTNGTPDLQGRVIVGVGSGTGLTARNPNDVFGSETHTLSTSEIPSHSHTPTAASIVGKKVTMHEGFSVQEAGGDSQPSYSFQNTQPTFAAAADFFVSAGGGGSHNNVQPSRALYYIIRTSRLA